MLVKLTHPEPNYDFWVDPMEIIMMERYNRPQSIIITQNSDKPSVTALVMRNGKTVACKETPEEIHFLINKAQAEARNAFAAASAVA